MGSEIQPSNSSVLRSDIEFSKKDEKNNFINESLTINQKSRLQKYKV